MNPGEPSHRFVLGIDAGQTSTKAILAHVATGVTVHASGGPVDHFRHHGAVERNAGVIEHIVHQLCARAGIDRHQIGAACAGWTGIRPLTPEVEAAAAIIGDLLPQAHCRVLPDYIVSLAGAAAGGTGIVVIAGGGSIAYGVAGDGRDAVVGGMGYILGDEGSAYDIGRRAVIAATRSSDGRDRWTALEALIRERFALDDVRAITRVVYTHDFSRATIANLVPDVVATAQTGDAVARDILTDAGSELGRAAVAVARKLAMTSPVIYTAGGVFRAGEFILAPFRAVVAEALHEAEVASAIYPPVVGALLLARRSVLQSHDQGWIATVAGAAP